jgi:hypothetical protein
MAKCKFYDVCPNGGVFSRCTGVGYIGDCVPHIFKAFEDEAKWAKSFNELMRKKSVRDEEPRKPIKVKVRRHKKPEGRVEVGSDSINFYFDGEKLAFFKDGALTMQMPPLFDNQE